MHQPPREHDLEQWFLHEQYGGLGIVWGLGLVVVDFDDPTADAQFQDQLEGLTQTFTVRSGTRGLPHRYYRLASHHNVRTRAFNTGEVRGEGSQVVPPPTRVGEYHWQVQHNHTILNIQPDDLDRMIQFFEGFQLTMDSELLEAALMVVSSDNHHVRFSVSASQLLNLYRVMVEGTRMRNRSLFQTALYAHDCGWSFAEIVDTLAVVHATEPPRLGQKQEAYGVRLREANRTIQSAMNTRYRSFIIQRSTPSIYPTGLPNSVREALLAPESQPDKRKSSNARVTTARVLDSLYMADWQQGQTFTEAEAVTMMKETYGLSRKPVQTALKLTVNDQPIFEPMRPQNRQASPLVSKPCFDSGQAGSKFDKPNKQHNRGRPAKHFVLPTHEQLYRWLKVKPSPSDELYPDELKSNTAYRKGLQRALIARRPGIYAQGWFAKRLGVTP